MSHSCPLNTWTGCLKGAAIATDRLSLPLSIIHAFEERITRHFSQPLPFVYKIHLFPFTPASPHRKTSYHFSQESLPKEITRATSKSCIHHLLAVPVFEQRLLENMEGGVAYENDLNLKATELRLGLPGTSCTNEEQAVSGARNNKRPLPETREERGAKGKSDPRHDDQETAPAPK